MAGYRVCRLAMRGTSAQEWRATVRVFEWVSGWIARLDSDNVIEFFGSTFEVALCDYAMLLALKSRSYERLMATIFRHCAAPGTSVLDVGANIGLYTVLAANSVGPSGRVVAVEPSSNIRQMLVTNLRRNGVGDVTIIPVAASDVDGHVRLSRPVGFYGLSSLSPPQGEPEVQREYEDVVQARLDDVLATQSFDLIKMDIEGHEYHALRGMLSLLRPSSILFLEYSEHPDGEAMRALGSSMWPHVAVIDERRQRVVWSSWDQLAQSRRTNVVASSAGPRLRKLLAPWDGDHR
jgi:FkbM family methyltransferase